MAADSNFEIAVQLEFLDASAKTPFNHNTRIYVWCVFYC